MFINNNNKLEEGGRGGGRRRGEDTKIEELSLIELRKLEAHQGKVFLCYDLQNRMCQLAYMLFIFSYRIEY